MPNNAVHVPGDVWAGVTREAADIAADSLGIDASVLDGVEKGMGAPYSTIAAALRRLAPYLPSEEPQEAVQPPCDVEPGE